MRTTRPNQRGFTLIELLLVIGIMGILFTMATFSLVNTQRFANINATVDQLVTDLRAQQTKAMIGSKDTTGVENSYGISFSSSAYDLFQGASPVSGDFTVTPAGITFTNTLTSNKSVFGERSGEICANTCGPYTVTVKSSSSTQQRVLTINKYGVVISNVLQ